MGKRAVAAHLDDRMQAIRQNKGEVIHLDEISSVVGSLIEGKTPTDDQADIAAEIRDLLNFVNAAKTELIGMQPKTLSSRDIPEAGVQLDAVVGATEEAASTIMNAADQLGDLADEIGDKEGARLMNISTVLFEASSFQDLTGQRITKVTNTLTVLEERLNALADAIGDDYIAPADAELEVDEDGVAVHDADLLHGPQLEGEGNSQDEIDAILAAFD